MVKYIIAGLVLLLTTLSVAIAVPLALHNNQSVSASAKSTYLYSLTNNDKEKYIVTNLADGRLVRLQLVLELDGDKAPKDVKNPGREFLVLQDTLLQTIRRCHSRDLEPQNQITFKKAVADSATKVLGKQSVLNVYIASIAFQ